MKGRDWGLGTGDSAGAGGPRVVNTYRIHFWHIVLRGSPAAARQRSPWSLHWQHLTGPLLASPASRVPSPAPS
jgi:hypothetical protein